MQNIDLSNFKYKKTALVMSGGVVKAAAWHLGVALALEEIGFTLKHNNSIENPDLEISTYVGSSAGSLIGSYFAAGHGPMDVIESMIDKKSTKLKPVTYKDMLYIKKRMKKPPRGSNYSPFSEMPFFARKILSPFLDISGLFSTYGLYKYVIDNVVSSNNFDDFDADLFVVATQLDHSRKCIFSKYNYPNPGHDSTASYLTNIPLADAVAASMSVPPFYSPYPIERPNSKKVDYYIDGEIRETLSTHVSVDNKCEYIISSWTHTPYHFQDEIGSLVNYGIPAISIQAIYLMIQKKIVESRSRRNTAKDLLDTIQGYMESNNISYIHQEKIISIISRKLNFDPKIKLIDIYPDHDDHQTFFKSSFSLDPKISSQIVQAGYKRTLSIFEQQLWED